MTRPESTVLSGELQPVFDRAAAFADSPKVTDAFREAAREPKLWAEAGRDPAVFLRERGIDVPEGLEVILLDDSMQGRPTPDFEFFTIRLFNCRTYWVKKEGAGYERVEICWGFEVVPNPVPGGPIG